MNSIVGNVKNLERILDNLKDGIVAHDFQRRIFYFNSEAERITGFSRENVIGKDCHDALGGPLCGARCSFCGESVDLAETTSYQTNIVTRSGETRTVEMTVSMMKDDEEQPFGVLAVFRDLTDLLELRRKAGEMVSFSNIIGRDVKMLDVFQQVRDVAEYDFPVHLFGETGTGKELVAAAIHNESQRGGGPFVPINCGALPENLIESELFGHVKGAFSGAVRDKKGRFELAEGGTVFLDEVAELSLEMQVKLLRFLQEGTFEKVGGEKTLTSDVRIISATNKDLKKEVKAGRFREDLFYRLNVIPIILPPLRERRNDIPLLVDHFLDKCTMRHGRKSPDFSKDAMSRMVAYTWPGNVRELENAVQFSIVRCKGKTVMPSDLPMELGVVQEESVKRGPTRKLEDASVREALVKTGGNKAKAARILGVGRATLYRFLDDHPSLADE
ncbi:sigma-54 interaction domain-containing protein [Desulfoluna butyratoxydans]|uniref:sigma-54 interaction domain-containing protein n=1 Tax=Desulfoluna butyratoxydans TaxID=231438 RepID=UPI001FE7866C|nr:sigma 54-interacting transcriptional regulator [Desulfoluna butyratoxydans]